MNRMSQKVLQTWVTLGPGFLPFADAATPDLPLSRLLRLSLFQVSVGMALVLLIGTLNRVMIVELGVPASLVGIMISVPLLFAPFRALIGFRSDVHVSALGWRRVPFIWKGTMLQFGGLAIMPFALLVLSGAGDSARAPVWVGQAAAALSFLLVGAGLHVVQTVGLALATDLAPPASRPKVVGLMYVMLLLGMVASAFIFGAVLDPFSPGRLIRVIQAAAVATIILNVVALWKQETRHSARARAAEAAPDFRASWQSFVRGRDAKRRLVAIGLGTMGFGMADVLLEPYGGQVLGLAVADTTKLTATLAVGGLLGFALASRILGRGFDPMRMAAIGLLVGVPAFLLVIAAGPLQAVMPFALGTLLVGMGAGLFGHGTLTATMNEAPAEQAGLALGAWGAVQATAAGLAIAMGGVVRDVVMGWAGPSAHQGASAFLVVYAAEVIFLLVALAVVAPLAVRRPGRPQSEWPEQGTAARFSAGGSGQRVG
jgi:BCD family chlorophyll transporter-like MFS transporter